MSRRLKKARSRISASILAMRSVSRAIAWVARPAESDDASTLRLGAWSASCTVTEAAGGGPDQNFSLSEGETSRSPVSRLRLLRSNVAVTSAWPCGPGSAIGPILSAPALSATGAVPSGRTAGALSSSLARKKPMFVSSSCASGSCALATTRPSAAGSLRMSSAPAKRAFPLPARPAISAAGFRPVEAKSSAPPTSPTNPVRRIARRSAPSAPESVANSPMRRSVA